MHVITVLIRNTFIFMVKIHFYVAGELIVRLVNGTNRCNGILELNRYSNWERACSNNWDLALANTVCKELYCGEASYIQRNISDTESQDGVWMNNVYCSRYETTLSMCSSDPLSNAFCISSQQIRIFCTGQVIINDATLSDQTDRCSGSVLFSISSNYYRNYQKVPVLSWDIKDANVVCKGRNCGFAVAANFSIENVRHSAWLSIRCNGDENSFSNCLLSATDANGTRYANYPAVQCSGPFTVSISNGTNCSGIVEANYNNIQGYISAEGWDINDANVVCQSLGCGFAVQALTIERDDSAPIWFKDFQCTGTEYSLSICLGALFLTNVCNPVNIAGVSCAKDELAVRLTNGTNRCNGILEVSISSNWKHVCANNQSLSFGSVICRDLICGQALSIQYNISNERNSELVVLDNINCNGYESSLSKCWSYPWKTSSCNSSQEVTITCSGSQRAVYASILYQGEYCTGNVQFALANDGWSFWNYQIVPIASWDINDANVVCRQSGCGIAVAATTYLQYGRVSAVLDMQCHGNETSMFYCPQSVIDPDRSQYALYPAVQCTGYFYTTMSNGSHRCSGSIDVWNKGTSSPVSADGWDINAANVACRSQGCGFALANVSNPWHGTGSVTSWINKFQCSGIESSLSYCSVEFREINITNSSPVAGVICSSGRVWDNGEGGDVCSRVGALETEWQLRLDACRPPGLNDFISLKPLLKLRSQQI
ncbi:deleted in malignant brain tumors 1 protein-like [Protopterus annectens]|uniref:deleted in malignant brain tumors 1 protein-like n=1 Tax=Protopterus annectens TaxID=7888 RepID=UPI001CFA15BB|nr:deleted in malignant brain tumors 1 protein-like [Protopterus annectens]